MRELQVLINYNNYGARSDGIFVRFFFGHKLFFHHFSAMLLLFFWILFWYSLICDGFVVFFSGVCYFTMESLILAQDER